MKHMHVNKTKVQSKIAAYNKVLGNEPSDKPLSPVAVPMASQVKALEALTVSIDDRIAIAFALGVLDSTDGFPRPLLSAMRLQLRKDDDYNQGTVKLDDYFPFLLKSYVQEINKKSLRLVSLAQAGRVPSNETVRDTLLDLINYCCFALSDQRLLPAKTGGKDDV